MWVCGCEHNCKNCFNKDIQDYYCGETITDTVIKKICNTFKNEHIKSFVLSGGDPLAIKNRDKSFQICSIIKRLYPHINIIVYTGYKIEELPSDFLSCLTEVVDYIIDGRYEEDKKPEKLQLRGSINQKCWKINHVNNQLIDYTDEYFK